jgi:hypothetical protein
VNAFSHYFFVDRADHNKTQTAEGRLVTSLCEDVYSLAFVQLRTIRDRLTRRSEALVQAVGVIFKNLYEKQTLARDGFCTGFEECCACANDFIRMSDKVRGSLGCDGSRLPSFLLTVAAVLLHFCCSAKRL